MDDDVRPVALTVAGSDSGGGAGIQADLRAFTCLGAFGTSVITCVTAQNLEGVRSVHALPPVEVQRQLEAVLDGFPVAAAKTGMLYSRAIIDVVAAAASRPGFPPLVVDPVMVATSGARLLEDDAVDAYRERLLRHAAVVTPNLDEAAVFLGRRVRNADDMPDAAKELADRLGCPVLLKGGHLDGNTLVDVLWDGGEFHRWEGERIEDVTTHGTGCTLSAAVAAGLALDMSLSEACTVARAYVMSALADPVVLVNGTRLLGGG